MTQRLDDLLGLPRLGTAAISPDGYWAAWTWTGMGPSTDVFAAPVDGSMEAIRLTETTENTMLVSWTPDSRGTIVAQDHGGDERVQLFRVDVDRPGVMQPLTEPSPRYFLRGGQLHPNGRWLVYAMNSDVRNDLEIEATWVYRHDLESGERLPLARPEKGGYYTPQLNDAGTHILYGRQDLHPDGHQIWLVDIEGREDREILNFGPRVKVEASWFPDSRRVLFLAEAGTYRRVGIWDVDGTIRWLLDDPARNIEQAFVPKGSEPAVAVVVDIRDARAASSLIAIDSGIESALSGIPGTLVPERPLQNGEWAAHHYSATNPGDLVRFCPTDLQVESFASITGIWDRTALRSRDLVAAEDFRWTSTDGLEIQGWLYRSATPTRGTIIQIHGGPTSHSEDDFSPLTQFFTSEGFNVLAPNYRGSTGLGLAYEEAIKEDGWGGREQDDICAGIEALIEAGIAQPGRVGVTGTSYGGYSSWCAITRCPTRLVAAAAPICGMTDLVVDYETTRPDLRPYSEAMLGGRPDQMPERYHERSPIHFVDRIRGRILIVQGMRDPNVSPANVLAVRAALDRAGIAYEVLAFEDEGHGIGRRENRRTLYERLVQFFSEAFN